MSVVTGSSSQVKQVVCPTERLRQDAIGVLNAIVGEKQLDLYNPVGENEERQRRYIIALSTFIAFKIGADKELFWLNFTKYVQDNAALVSNLVTVFISEYIQTRNGVMRSISKAVTTRLLAYKRFGITVSTELSDKVASLQKNWNLDAIDNGREYLELKTTQSKAINASWNEILLFLCGTHPTDFRAVMLEIVNVAPPTVCADNLRHITTLTNVTPFKGLSDTVLYGVQLRTYSAVLCCKVMGSRQKHLLPGSIDQYQPKFNEEQHGRFDGLLYTYKNYKTGNGGKTFKVINVYFMPHVNVLQCPVVGFAIYVSYLSHVLGQPTTAPFMYRVNMSTKRPHTRANVKLSAVLAVVGYRFPGSMDTRKGHIFRFVCNNELIKKGVDANNRNLHLGWTSSSIGERVYADPEELAQRNTSALALSGQSDTTDAHAIWSLVDKVPSNVTALLNVDETANPTLIQLLKKVTVLALASGEVNLLTCGYFKDVTDNPLFVSFKNIVVKCISVKEVKVSGSNAVLKRKLQFEQRENLLKTARIEELERALANRDSGSNVQMVTTTTPAVVENPIEAIKVIVMELVNLRVNPDFLQLVNSRLDSLLWLIDSLPGDGFGFRLDSATGKNLQRILLLGSAMRRHDESGLRGLLAESKCSCYINVVKKHRNSSPLFATISTRSFTAYCRSLNAGMEPRVIQ